MGGGGECLMGGEGDRVEMVVVSALWGWWECLMGGGGDECLMGGGGSALWEVVGTVSSSSAFLY